MSSDTASLAEQFVADFAGQPDPGHKLWLRALDALPWMPDVPDETGLYLADEEDEDPTSGILVVLVYRDCTRLYATPEDAWDRRGEYRWCRLDIPEVTRG